MNFAEFSAWRTRCLIEQPGLLDCSETNVYRVLNYLRPVPWATESPGSQLHHRCDLARAWLRRYEYPEPWSRRTLICRGVRHALSLLLNERSLQFGMWWMPRDVYPIYLELARAAQVEPLLYTTLPTPIMPSGGPARGGETLLLPNPLKPLGRFLTDAECEGVLEWLAASESRHVVLDCAYDMGAPLHSTTRRLWDFGQAIVLHTITKGWLSPKTFGVSLVPKNLQPALEMAFRRDPPTPEQLHRGHDCLSVDDSLPRQVAADLNQRRAGLMDSLPAEFRDRLVLPQAEAATGCYLFPVTISEEVLLRDYRILAVPAAAFGGPPNMSVLSSLTGENSGRTAL